MTNRRGAGGRRRHGAGHTRLPLLLHLARHQLRAISIVFQQFIRLQCSVVSTILNSKHLELRTNIMMQLSLLEADAGAEMFLFLETRRTGGGSQWRVTRSDHWRADTCYLVTSDRRADGRSVIVLSLPTCPLLSHHSNRNIFTKNLGIVWCN